MKIQSNYDAVVIGGGQAGLSASVHLQKCGVEHVVLERNRVAESWRSQRWDNFCLVTPNWQCTLPEFAYDKEYRGGDRDGFMKRDEIVEYIEAFRQSKAIPVVEGVEVHQLSTDGEGFRLKLSSDQTLRTTNVIVATGGYHVPRIPPAAQSVPAHITQIHSSQYKNAARMPDGGVLVVGTGQSGCQIAEDLHLEGKQVHLAVGRAPRAPRYYRGRDVTAWLVDMGAYDVTVDEHPMGKDVRKKTNHYLTGRDGGREIDLRRFAREGMDLRGRFLGIDGDAFRFQDDLSENLDNADASVARIKNEIDLYIDENGMDCPPGESYEPVWFPTQTDLALPFDSVGSIVWCTGFRKDYEWMDIDVFDDESEPIYDRGVTPVPGLYFLGLPWMHTWGSGRFGGVAADAGHVVRHLADRHANALTTLERSIV
ncbi:MAG: MSMEG_0569 family flavin-dependent oxidoreductase [Planctomycetota bacterium]